MSPGDGVLGAHPRLSKTIKVNVFPNSKMPPKEDKSKALLSLVGHTEPVRSVAVTPIVTGSYDKTCKVFNLASGECLMTINGHLHGVTSVAVTSDGSKVVTGSFDKTSKVFDLINGDCLLTLTGHNGRVNFVTITRDGTKCITCCVHRVRIARPWWGD